MTREVKVKILSSPPTVHVHVDAYCTMVRFFGKSKNERFAFLHGFVNNEEKIVDIMDVSIPPQKSGGASVEPNYDDERWMDWDLEFIAKCKKMPCVGIAHSFSGGAHHSGRDENTDALLGEESKDAKRNFVASITCTAGPSYGNRRDFRVDIIWTPDVKGFQAAYEDVEWYYWDDESKIEKALAAAEPMVTDWSYTPPVTGAQGVTSDGGEGYDYTMHQEVPSGTPTDSLDEAAESKKGKKGKKGKKNSDNKIYRADERFTFSPVTNLPIAVVFYNFDRQRYETIDQTLGQRTTTIDGILKSINPTTEYRWHYSVHTKLFECWIPNGDILVLKNGHIRTYNPKTPGWRYPESIVDPKEKTTDEDRRIANKNMVSHFIRTSMDYAEIGLIRDCVDEIVKRKIDITARMLKVTEREFDFVTMKGVYGRFKANERSTTEGRTDTVEMLSLGEWWKSTNPGLYVRVAYEKETQRCKYVYVLVPDSGDILEYNEFDANLFPAGIPELFTTVMTNHYYDLKEWQIQRSSIGNPGEKLVKEVIAEEIAKDAELESPNTEKPSATSTASSTSLGNGLTDDEKAIIDGAPIEGMVVDEGGRVEIVPVKTDKDDADAIAEAFKCH